MTFDVDSIAALPKVLLHDHLDGGLRPATILDLAAAIGYEPPAGEPGSLGRWFTDEAGTGLVDGVVTGSLVRYIKTFEVTLAVMQTADALRRVAREAVLDLAADGVVYAEQRYAPEQHLAAGLSLQQVVDAVQDGFTDGITEAAQAGHSIRIGTLLTAMRQLDRWDDIAELALANRDNGVVGFDLAGPEDGFAPTRHLSAFQQLRNASFPVTVHAGEADGLESIAGALHRAGTTRLGHGMRIVDDIEVLAPAGSSAAEQAESAQLGHLAHWVRDRQIALELCPTSNTQTRAAVSVAAHPISLLKELGFAVTVNTDNRLQSATSMTREMTRLVTEAGWTLDDLRAVTVTAAWNAFIHLDDRQDLVDQVILPGYATRPTGRHGA